MSEFDIMNESVAIFWKSQSAEHLNDCLLMYEGQIVRYDHDEKQIKLVLEDKTLYKIDKDVPIANLGTSQRVYRDKDKNKYIPISYGRIPYAPALMYAMTSDEIEQVPIQPLSPEEIEFYESFVELMRKYEYNQEGYIPHMMMNSFESFANRGLFGLYNS